MLFSSIVFLFTFLPAVLVLYYLLPERFHNPVLLLASLIFYAWGEPVYIFLMLLSILFNYFSGLDIARNLTDRRLAKRSLIFNIVVNIAILGFFKYEGFVLDSLNAVLPVHITYHPLALPIGISFYTFQILSYIIDVYRRNVKVQKNILNFALYVTMFPQLIAGPIVQYADVEEQLVNRESSWDKFGEGCMYFIRGLAKKVLLANTSGMIFTEVTGLGKGNVSVLSAWLGAFAYMFQIYFDFSGYSDMAVGLGKMFGFEFCMNFNYPYIAKSITEFWRRWHISLSTWFREYLYIPLGGNRKGKAKTYWNKLIVFFCTGLWHGANWTFIVWGLWHGFFIVAEDAVKKLFGLEKHGKDGQNPACAVLKHLYTLLVVLVGFVIFRADNMGQAFSMIGAMFSGGSASAQTGLLAQCLTPLTLFALAVGLVGSTPVLPLVCRKAEQQTGSVYACLQALSCAGVLVDILHLSAASYVPFIYFQF